MTPTLTKADPQPTTQAKPLIQHYEQAECPGCESAIRPTHVFRTLDAKQAYEPVRRTVKAYCLHCDTGWVVKQALRGGVWQNETDVQRISHPKQMAGLLARVGHVDGDVHREAIAG